jgi:hypothetical protein
MMRPGLVNFCILRSPAYRGGEDMLEPGTRVVMRKGYKGVKGMIAERTDSRFEFYIVKLDNGIHIVVGPSAFVREENKKMTRQRRCHS